MRGVGSVGCYYLLLFLLSFALFMFAIKNDEAERASALRWGRLLTRPV